MPKKKTHVPIIQDKRFLPPLPFEIEATTISSNEKADVRVANRNRTRKISKKMLPNAICSNTEGKTINSNPGPAVGSKPNENTAGKIAKPANKDINKFIATIENAG